MNQASHRNIYFGLLALTAASVGISKLELASPITVLLIFSIAVIQSIILMLYGMGLKVENRIVYGIVLLGFISTLILAAGILPDLVGF